MGRWSGPNIVNGVRLPQRMFPRNGGEPLPWEPIVAPGHTYPSPEEAAKRYVAELDKELATGEDGGEAKWDARQRQYIRTLRQKWVTRMYGMDAHYKKHGTFPRPMNADPPGWGDVRTEESRRKARDEGTYVSNAEHKRQKYMSRSEHVHAICRRMKKEWAVKQGQNKPSKPQND